MRVIFAAMALLFSSLLSATTLNNVIVFGDSLSDNGNLYRYMKNKVPSDPPYHDGRFANGPVWVEKLMDMYFPADVSQSHLLDFAYGGAGVSEEDSGALFTLRKEIDSYLLLNNNKVDPSSLVVVWMGANNYLNIPENVDTAVDEVNLGIKHSLERLVERGGKYFLVLNLPDLGRTPAARMYEEEVVLSQLTHQHNAAIKNLVQEMSQRYPQVEWLTLDVNEIFTGILDNPSQYGFTNTTDTCYEAMTPSLHAPAKHPTVMEMVSSMKMSRAVVDACTGYLFFDPVHPSERAHQIMAERAKKLFDEGHIEFK